MSHTFCYAFNSWDILVFLTQIISPRVTNDLITFILYFSFIQAFGTDFVLL
jgi:hypothetical protein